MLRQFRDRWLLTNAPGRAFVDAYYRWSPPVAQVIANSAPLRFGARVVLTPVIFAVEYPLPLVLCLAAMLLWVRRFLKRRSERLAS
ncbi:MAG: hypothetical protein HY319_12550 [Armatimonadetes bacterium]|nr:hypothetical protein [Armatimonadota bacterium]